MAKLSKLAGLGDKTPTKRSERGRKKDSLKVWRQLVHLSTRGVKYLSWVGLSFIFDFLVFNQHDLGIILCHGRDGIFYSFIDLFNQFLVDWTLGLLRHIIYWHCGFYLLKKMAVLASLFLVLRWPCKEAGLLLDVDFLTTYLSKLWTLGPVLLLV